MSRHPWLLLLSSKFFLDIKSIKANRYVYHSSPQYRDMLAKSRAEKRTAREAKLTDGGEAFMPDDNSVAESTSTWGVVNLESSDLVDPMEELRMPSSKSPWVISTFVGFLMFGTYQGYISN